MCIDLYILNFINAFFIIFLFGIILPLHLTNKVNACFSYKKKINEDSEKKIFGLTRIISNPVGNKNKILLNNFEFRCYEKRKENNY